MIFENILGADRPLVLSLPRHRLDTTRAFLRKASYDPPMVFRSVALYCVVVTLLVKPFGFYMNARLQRRTYIPVASAASGRADSLLAQPASRKMRSRTGRVMGVAMIDLQPHGFPDALRPAAMQAVLRLIRNISTRSPQISPSIRRSARHQHNWKSYLPETTMSYLPRWPGSPCIIRSAATGIALAIALIRGSARRSAKTIGNFGSI